MDLLDDLKSVRQASRELVLLDENKINEVLKDLADLLITETENILAENARDLKRMAPADPKYDRLKLTAKRIEDISGDVRNVVKLEYPVGNTLEARELPNGLKLSKVSVPLGIIGIIYEARPNVTIDVFSLCLKSGNACVLKGGSDASFSNAFLVSLIHRVLKKHNLPEYLAYLMPTDRSALEVVLNAVDYIDVIIPRGGQNLINFVREHSKVPVIETGAGIVHTFFDESGDLETGKRIIHNAKTRRPSVCNSLDTLIIHRSRLKDLAELVEPLNNSNVEIYSDGEAYPALSKTYNHELLHQANEEDFGKEFLSLKMSVKIVNNIQEALEHIAKYSSKHSEAIISNDEKNIELFFKSVDAAAVYSNTSTAFTDGAQFGLGAEIGISTQKIHARGPMAIKELTSYKWLVRGQGQVRE